MHLYHNEKNFCFTFSFRPKCTLEAVEQNKIHFTDNKGKNKNKRCFGFKNFTTNTSTERRIIHITYQVIYNFTVLFSRVYKLHIVNWSKTVILLTIKTVNVFTL